MEVTRRRLVDGVTSNSSSKVPLDQLYALDLCEVPATDEKFAGYKGCSVRALLGAAKSGTGVFIAGDGMQTEPIAFEHLVLGILMHTDAARWPTPRLVPAGMRATLWQGEQPVRERC